MALPEPGAPVLDKPVLLRAYEGGTVIASESVAVIGMGEIGKPLLDLISTKYKVRGIDIDTRVEEKTFDIIHICYPFKGDDFIDTTVAYIKKYTPRLVIINSTVTVGTTRRIHAAVKIPIVNSPVRGKHVKMSQDMLHYTKFIGGIDEAAGKKAAEHFKKIGMKTKVFQSPETTELAKLTETTYFGVLIAWAQEVERYCQAFGVEYDDVVSIYEEIDYLPRVKFFPGVIGGHCVMPNIALLKSLLSSNLLDAIVDSNNKRKSS
jgi:UDP-N-acetyl-D-mannosaminuronate dehydrogenase